MKQCVRKKLDILFDLVKQLKNRLHHQHLTPPAPDQKIFSRSRHQNTRIPMLTSQSLIKHLRRVNLSLQHKIIPSITVAARSFQTTPEEYSVLKSESLDPSGKFWLDYANSKLHWDVKPKIAIDHSNAPFYRWFPDGQINVCHQMLDRHIEAGNGEVVAIAYDSVVGGLSRNITVGFKYVP